MILVTFPEAETFPLAWRVKSEKSPNAVSLAGNRILLNQKVPRKSTGKLTKYEQGSGPQLRWGWLLCDLT